MNRLERTWRVTITVELFNGNRLIHGWEVGNRRTMKRGAGSAITTALRWTREQLREDQVHGRASIRAYNIDAEIISELPRRGTKAKK